MSPLTPTPAVPDKEGARHELHIVITGQVKRIGFRLFTRDLALQHRVTGWVRNRRAAVEIKAQGEIEDLKSFLTDVADGPPSAQIDSVETNWAPALTRQQRFRIRWFYLF